MGDYVSKIKVKIQIKNNHGDNKFDTIAILQDEVIKYTEEDNTKVKYNYKNNELIRENNELLMKYSFNSDKITKGEILVKELDRNLDIEIKTKSIDRKDNDLKVEFSIEDEKFIYRIEEVK